MRSYLMRLKTRKELLDYLKEHPIITPKEIEEFLECSRAQSYRIYNDLKKFAKVDPNLYRIPSKFFKAYFDRL